MITGEYGVLDGAKALAIPTKYGHYLTVKEADHKRIKWTSLDDENGVWFEATYELEPVTEISSSNSKISNTLLGILIEAQKLNPYFLMGDTGYHIETKLTFPRDWGLGTSSTLINNIAQWANVNSYELLKQTFGGSGYDIACAQRSSAILYQRTNNEPLVEDIVFDPVFKDQLYFVYLNKKQNSREAIAQYRNLNFDSRNLVDIIGGITTKMVSCNDLETFQTLIELHETTISKTLKIPTIKELLFNEYPGSIKSLGAWGGDFILVTGDKNTMAYFKQKGYDTLILFSEMIL